MNLRAYFLNLKIRVKLLLAFGSLIILLVATVFVFFHTLKNNNRFQKASEDIDGVNIALLEMDGALKYFMFEGFKEESFQKNHQSKYLAAYAGSLAHTRENLTSLQFSKLDLGDSLLIIDQLLKSVDHKVKILEELLIERGFKDFGKEGQLRDAIHKVENSSFAFDKTEMLMLRRHEKDFFLRKDLKYQNEFNKRLEAFSVTILESNGSSEIFGNLNSYRTLFNEVVEIEKKIGLKDSEGYKGMINKDLGQLRTAAVQIRNSIKANSNSFKQQSQLTLVIILAVQFILGVVLAIVYSDILTNAIKELQRGMQSVSNGIFPKPLPVNTIDEIGKTKIAFNQLLERIKAATRFSEALGKGELEANYDERFSEDVLAKSMTAMQHQLKEALDKQRTINWTNQGSAMLNDILKNENEELNVLGDKLLRMLVHYLNANQGALYVLKGSENDGALERISTYAYNKKKYINNTVQLNEGLLGQCFLLKEEIILTDVPRDYIKITSGLGEAIPRFIVLMPLVIQNRSMGVMELASFEKMESYKIEFLKKISESIASILINKQVNTETKRLLKQAQEREQRLAESEEELRQNAEEMQTVQEQMKRQQQILEGEISELKQLLEKSRVEEIVQPQ